MKEKIKEIFKSRVFLCVVIVLVFGTIGVSAATYFPSNDVTYDNKESGLSSTDVQGAIDELYNTCSKATSSGNYIYYGYEYNNDYRIYKANTNTKETSIILELENQRAPDIFAAS